MHNICDLISEMNRKISNKDFKNYHRRNEPKKPFWTTELDNMFKTLVGKERAMRKCKQAKGVFDTIIKLHKLILKEHIKRKS